MNPTIADKLLLKLKELGYKITKSEGKWVVHYFDPTNNKWTHPFKPYPQSLNYETEGFCRWLLRKIEALNPEDSPVNKLPNKRYKRPEHSKEGTN